MHVSKSQRLPRRTCAKAILRLSGDFVRIVAAVFCAHSASAPPDDRFSIESVENVFNPIAAKSRSIARLALRDRPLPGRFGEGGKHRIDGDRAGQPIEQRAKLRGRNAMRCDAARNCIRNPEALAGQRTIGTELSRHARQKPGGARHPEKSRCRLPAWRKRTGHLRRDASRAPTRRRRRPSRCRRSMRRTVCDSS